MKKIILLFFISSFSINVQSMGAYLALFRYSENDTERIKELEAGLEETWLSFQKNCREIKQIQEMKVHSIYPFFIALKVSQQEHMVQAINMLPIGRGEYFIKSLEVKHINMFPRAYGIFSEIN